MREFIDIVERAYHGTRAIFAEFSHDHSGTGEGGAMMGWGLYFTACKTVADSYRNHGHALENVEARIGGKPVSTIAWLKHLSPGWLDMLWHELGHGKIEDALGMIDRLADQPGTKAKLAALARVRNAILTGKVETRRNTGSIITVELPQGPYLDWEARRDEQPPEVLSALQQLYGDREVPDEIGRVLFGLLVPGGHTQASKPVALRLARLGIVGVKTEFFSDTHYVIWDARNVKIVDRDGPEWVKVSRPSE